MSYHRVYECAICKERHSLRDCPIFIMMTVADRRVTVRNHKYCMNCLAKSHTVENCHSSQTCRKCGYQHHTMLHPQISLTPTATTPSCFTPRTTTRRPNTTPQTNASARRRPTVTRTVRTTRRTMKKNPIAQQPASSTRRPTKPNRANKKNKKRPAKAKLNQQVLAEAIKSLATVLCQPDFA
ncbi:uncharacterized protein LOC142234410 [Haematobia irritans]|uniref:uncharacterized protein LOC142229774 n=1 Tax=Haematobia irritans TaxID=7368 RepID=UPI003F4FEAEA